MSNGLGYNAGGMIATWIFRPVLAQLRRRVSRRIRWWAENGPVVLCEVLALLSFFYIACWAPGAFGHWAENREVRRRGSIAAEADLAYDDILADPQAHAGKFVRWHLVRRGNLGWFYKGDPDRPITWSRPPPEAFHATEKHSIALIARVVRPSGRGVRLAYEGRDGDLFMGVRLPF